MFAAQLHHLPDGNTEAGGEDVSVGREPGLEHRSLGSAVASWRPITCQDASIRAPFPEGKSRVAKLPSQHSRLFGAGPQVFHSPN